MALLAVLLTECRRSAGIRHLRGSTSAAEGKLAVDVTRVTNAPLKVTGEGVFLPGQVEGEANI